ncbi:Uncharacterised protein [Klebsiella pneumoniae]|nr:Uncharacterised protein [Klebsiella pneumoniae]
MRADCHTCCPEQAIRVCLYMWCFLQSGPSAKLTCFPQLWPSTKLTCSPLLRPSAKLTCFPQPRPSAKLTCFPQSRQSAKLTCFPQSRPSAKLTCFPQSGPSVKLTCFPQRMENYSCAERKSYLLERFIFAPVRSLRSVTWLRRALVIVTEVVALLSLFLLHCSHFEQLCGFLITLRFYCCFATNSKI